MADGYEWLYEAFDGVNSADFVVRIDRVVTSASPTKYGHLEFYPNGDLDDPVREYQSISTGLKVHSLTSLSETGPNVVMDFFDGLPLLESSFSIGSESAYSLPVELRLEIQGEPDLNWFGTVTGRFRAESMESVRVPAGRFDAIRFSLQYQFSAQMEAADRGRYQVPESLNGREEATYWASAGIGIVKSEQQLSGNLFDPARYTKQLLEIPRFYAEAVLWYDGASPIQPPGWLYFDWFKGFKPEGENWFYHGRHGWLFVLADDTSGMFLWDGALGRWMFTNETAYPWMYAYGPDEGWVFFFEGGRPGSRFFKQGDTGEVVSEQALQVD